MSRVSSILHVIKMYWQLNPQYTLCEIISNASNEMLNTTDCIDLTDDLLVKYIQQKCIEKMNIKNVV